MTDKLEKVVYISGREGSLRETPASGRLSSQPQQGCAAFSGARPLVKPRARSRGQDAGLCGQPASKRRREERAAQLLLLNLPMKYTLYLPGAEWVWGGGEAGCQGGQ